LSKAASLVLGVYLLALTGCETKPPKQRALEARIRNLVDQRAPAEEVMAALGPPDHTYTREEVMSYLAKTPERDVAVRETWTLFSQYPETLYYKGPPTFQNYLFLDSNRKAAGFRFDVQ
jgi:hypothetical protein